MSSPAASPPKKNSISRTIPVSPQSRIQHGQAQLYYREVRQALQKESEARELRKEAARVQAKMTSHVDFHDWKKCHEPGLRALKAQHYDSKLHQTGARGNRKLSNTPQVKSSLRTPKSSLATPQSVGHRCNPDARSPNLRKSLLESSR